MEATRLDIEGITKTAAKLSARIRERFGERGITRLSEELLALSHATGARIEELRRPQHRFRWLIWTLVAAGVAVLSVSAARVAFDSEIEGIEEWLSVAQNGIQDAVFIGLAVIYLVNRENRTKQKVALEDLQELRSVAHVIDMHQLTKDPDTTVHPERRTAQSPERTLDQYDLNRYLDYCSEMLSLTSKLAALYAQDSSDAVVLDTVREIQDLTGNLSSQIWQKIMILDTLSDPSTNR